MDTASVISPDIAAATAYKAIELYNEVVVGNWDSRFSEIEVTALTERNAFVQHCRAAEVRLPQHMYSPLV